MDTPSYDKIINNLKSQVSAYDSSIKPTSKFIPNFSNFSNLFSNPLVKVGTLFIIIFIILVLLKPMFLFYDYTDEEGNQVRKLDYSKLFTSSVIITLVLSISFYVYDYKTNK